MTVKLPFYPLSKILNPISVTNITKETIKNITSLTLYTSLSLLAMPLSSFSNYTIIKSREYTLCTKSIYMLF